MAIMRFYITDLASHTVTRGKGRLAYENLKPHLQSNQPIEIDISGERPLSLSFLDELVLRLTESGRLSQVTFVVNERDALHKLSRIADIRQVDISYLDVNTALRKKVERLPAPRSKAIVFGMKPKDKEEYEKDA